MCEQLISSVQFQKLYC